MRSPARFKVIRAGRRFGKTILAVTQLIKESMQTPGDYWFIAPYYRQAKEIGWKMLLKMLTDYPIRHKNETELSVDLHNGSTIKLKGADNPESLKGVGLRGVILDEYAFTKPNVWQEIVRPMLFDSGGWCWFISTPYGYNHFWDLWEWVISDKNQSQREWARFHFTTYDNPHIQKEELESAKQTMSSERFTQEILAEFTKKTGLIWANFTRDIHVVARRNFDKQFVHTGSIDFGFAIGHPTSFSIYEWNNQGDIYTGDGFVEEGLNIEKISELMRIKTQGLLIRTIYCDSSRPDLANMLSEKGWTIEAANKDVELGIAKVDEFMQVNLLTGKPRWTIAEHMTKQIQQLENYQWQEIRGEDGGYRQMPKKENDDFCDELRYCLYTHTLPNQEFDKKLARIQMLAEAGEL